MLKIATYLKVIRVMVCMLFMNPPNRKYGVFLCMLLFIFMIMLNLDVILYVRTSDMDILQACPLNFEVNWRSFGRGNLS